jgi:long-chain acyl-CoA synthetase
VQADWIFNLACPASPIHYQRNPIKTVTTNVVGTQNVIAFTKRMKRPCLVHISTCFVAGNRSGAVFESDPVLGYFPRKNELLGVEFSVEQEIKDCAKLADRVREEARDAMMVARFRELARKRLNEEMRDDDPDALGLAVARERKVWTRNRLTELGVERAKFWGWPNDLYLRQAARRTAGRGRN